MRVADFMAAQIKVSRKTLRLLGPAAGTGVLCCAAVERLAAGKRLHRGGPGANPGALVRLAVGKEGLSALNFHGACVWPWAQG